MASLATDFLTHRNAFLSPDYGESSLREDFLNKFFTALGWDVGHETQKNPFKQEVKVERPVRHKDAKRRADYAFFVAPNFRDARLFVEAKRPSVDIKTKDHYFQAIRYGWNNQNPLVVLTNFDQLHILDCRYKPNIDTALDCAVRTYSCGEFLDPEKFAEMYYLLSREAVAAGALDDFAEALPKRRGKAVQRGLFKGGYQRLDRTFLSELESYREMLARSFKKTNPHLDGHALTEITQRVLDRLIFIRFLEDKLIEPDSIVANFGDRASVWSDFVATCRRLDSVYNGIVFRRHALIDSPQFLVDDAVFGDLCEDLSHVNSPYDFNSIPIHILGSIYERFLGRVITISGSKVSLVDKPEVRRAGGVYYTPEYVVQHIVQETVGKRIAGKSPAQMSQMRFCDIACGSGSFLLGMFGALLDEHRRWFNENPERAKKAGCVLGDDGQWHLSLSQKRKILVDGVFGVDLDLQAVEVAQLSLYLKLLEEETTASARNHQFEFHETILPSLSRNVICANSLIETDIFMGNLFAQEEERSLNPADLKTLFKRIMDEGGFDVIVGNPPYVRPHKVPKIQKEYFWAHYSVYTKKADIYACFVQRSTDLLKPDGMLSYIVSHGWQRLDSFRALRQHVLDNYRVLEICDMPHRVFEDAAVETSIFVFVKERGSAARERNSVRYRKCSETKLEPLFSDIRQISQSAFNASQLRVFDTSISPETDAVKAKMRGGPSIGDMFQVVFGLKTADDKKFIHRTTGLHKEDQPLLRGDDIRRYGFRWNGEYVWYVPGRMRKHRSTARPGEAGRFEQPKVLVKDTTKDFACTYEAGEYYVKDALIVIPRGGAERAYDLKFLAGVINSSALRFFYRTTFSTLHVQNGELASLPLPQIDFRSKEIVRKYELVIQLVEAMLDCTAQLGSAVTDADVDRLTKRCEAIDTRIDATVDSLYGLTAADRGIVNRTLSGDAGDGGIPARVA